MGIGFTTLATLILELSLTRIFSVVFFYHFAFLAISLALFGLGAGGVFSYVVSSRPGNLYAKLGKLAVANSVAVVLLLWFILTREGSVTIRLADRSLFRESAVLPVFRWPGDGGLARDLGSNRARRSRVLLRSGWRGRRMPAADPVPGILRRTKHRDRLSRDLRRRSRHLVQPGREGEAPGGGRADVAIAGHSDGGQWQRELVGRPLGEGRTSASRALPGVEQFLAHRRE